VSRAQKFKEALTFLRWRLAPAGPEQFDWLFPEIERYRATYERLTGKRFDLARLLEVGYGARPNRIVALMSMGIDVRGIDLDMPMHRFSVSRIFSILRTNGPERALKTAVRSLIFDGEERKSFRAALAMRGYTLRADPARFLVGDAATFDYGNEIMDMIYSEDVFEHIPEPDIEKILDRFATILSPNGVVIVTPNVFTGIMGGHLADWYTDRIADPTPKESEPWEHLRKARYAANTYLNRLPRSKYREIFSRHFEIIEETVLLPGLGRQWLTPEVREELASWSDDELFSNQVRFVLQPRKAVV
jgi:SAM-dependent methyltransferase